MEEKRKKIFEQFIRNDKLSFAEIEKETKIRSNLLAYYLKLLQNEEMIIKKGNHYFLTKKAEKYIPIYSNRNDELLPVNAVLVAVLNEDKILLINRSKRPFKNKWSLIASKIYFDETIPKVAVRCVKERGKINSEFKKINCVLQEHVKDQNSVKQSIIHNFCTVITIENKTLTIYYSEIDEEKNEFKIKKY